MAYNVPFADCNRARVNTSLKNHPTQPPHSGISVDARWRGKCDHPTKELGLTPPPFFRKGELLIPRNLSWG